MLRYSLVATAFFFILIGANVFSYNYFKKKLLYETIKIHSINIRNIYISTLTRKYAFLLDLLNIDKARWENSSQLKRFIAEADEFFGELNNVKQVVIYNEELEVLYKLHPINLPNITSFDLLEQDNIIIKTVKGGILTLLPLSYSTNSLKEVDGVLEIIFAFPESFTYISMILFLLEFSIILGFMLWFYRILHSNAQLLTEQQNINLKLKSAKTLAEEESVRKSQFIANMSHELRTPLNAIIGFSEIIKNTTSDKIDLKYKEYAGDIYNAGTHLLDLINDILDFSKSELNKLEIDPIWFELNKIIDVCFRMVTNKAQESGITLEKYLKEKTIIYCDPKRLKQVIINILSNSLKFTLKGGKVTLAVTEKDNYLMIKITDTGIGISPENLTRVVAGFRDCTNKGISNYEGTGLGLPLSKKLVELMGGKFTIQSALNKGTTVSLDFPVPPN